MSNKYVVVSGMTIYHKSSTCEATVVAFKQCYSDNARQQHVHQARDIPNCVLYKYATPHQLVGCVSFPYAIVVNLCCLSIGRCYVCVVFPDATIVRVRGRACVRVRARARACACVCALSF